MYVCNVAEIGIKFRLDKFPHKIANMFQLRDFAPFSDVCSHIFPLFNQMIWQTSDNLSEIVIGVDVGEVIDMAKRCQAIDRIKGELTKGLPVIGLIFFSFRDFPDECPSNDAWLAKFSFSVFSAVAYMIPCEPRPDIVRSASPVTCILNCTIRVSSFKCCLSWMWILNCSMNYTYCSGLPLNGTSFIAGMSLLASSLYKASTIDISRTPDERRVSSNSTKSLMHASTGRAILGHWIFSDRVTLDWREELILSEPLSPFGCANDLPSENASLTGD